MGWTWPQPRVSEGKRIGPALAAVQIADPVALRMLEVAQRTGRLAEVLARIAQFQEAQLARAVSGRVAPD